MSATARWVFKLGSGPGVAAAIRRAVRSGDAAS
jgi:hypothetical protein